MARKRKHAEAVVAIKDLPFPFWEPWAEIDSAKGESFSKPILTDKARALVDDIDQRRYIASMGIKGHTLLDEMDELSSTRTVGVPKFRGD